MELEGQVAIVTGAGCGIGRALELIEARQQIERVRDNGHVLFRRLAPTPAMAS